MEFDIEVKVHDYETDKTYTIKGTAHGAYDSIAFNTWVAKAVPHTADIIDVIKFDQI